MVYTQSSNRNLYKGLPRAVFLSLAASSQACLHRSPHLVHPQMSHSGLERLEASGIRERQTVKLIRLYRIDRGKKYTRRKNDAISCRKKQGRMFVMSLRLCPISLAQSIPSHSPRPTLRLLVYVGRVGCDLKTDAIVS